MIDEEASDGLEDLHDLINDEGDELKTNSAKKKGQLKSAGPQPVTIESIEWVKTEKEKLLEKIVFGDKEGLVRKFEEQAGDSTSSESKSKEKKRKPAWHDSDDDGYQVGDVVKETKRKTIDHLKKEKTYKEFLRNKFTRIVAQPKWADLDRKEEPDSDDDELLRTAGHLVHNTTAALPANNLQFKKLKNLNRATYAENGITSVQFHPTSTVAVVCSYNGLASVYALDGLKNEKLHNVQFKNFPIKCAKLLYSGAEVLIGGSRNFFYSYDLMVGEETRVFLPKIITNMNLFELSPCGKYFAVAGRFGEVHLMDVKSIELIHTYKQETPCTALHFSTDSKKLFTHSSGPEVSIFDLRRERVEHVFLDDGCINGKTLSISTNSKLLATGSNEGVVNVYNYSDVLTSKNPTPQKTIYNLTTAVSATKFNHSSELLGICSDVVAGAVKLVHFPSGTVFANFPGFQSNIGHIRIIEFSPNSGYLALGNTAKEAPLYRLKHFNNY